MRKLLLGFILVYGLLAVAQDFPMINPGGIDTSLPDSLNRDEVLEDTRDGVDPPAYATVSTKDDFLSWQSAAADDFTVTDCAWELTRIRAYGLYVNPFDGSLPPGDGQADSLNVYIIAKTGSVPTSTDLSGSALFALEDVSYTELDPGGIGGDFEVTIPDLVLQPGDYWLVVQANMGIVGGAAQWSWTESSLTVNSGTTLGDESAWFQDPGGTVPQGGAVPTCVGAWNSRVTGCSMTRNPDTNPPADRDLAFQIEGNRLDSPGVTVSQVAAVELSEDGTPFNYTVVLTAPPTPGNTVTVTPATSDSTEATVSAAVNFTNANWDIPQTITITPGASGDGNDGDVAFSITHTVSFDGAGGDCYDGINSAAAVNGTNANIDGIATIIVDPTSGLEVAENGSVTFNVSYGADVTPSSDVTIPFSVTTGDVTVDASAVLNAGTNNADVTISGIADVTPMVQGDRAFSISVGVTTSVDAQFNGIDPPNVSGTILDVHVASVTVTPNATPLSTNEGGATDTITYTLSAQPANDVVITLNSTDAGEATVTSSITFDGMGTNWQTGIVVTVTGQDDDIQDGTQNYSIIGANTVSDDSAWDDLSVSSAAGQNADDTDTAGVTVNEGDGVSTSEDVTVDSFTVVLDSEPVFGDVTITVTSSDTTEGLVGTAMGGPFASTVNLTFTSANWDTAQTVYVEGQDDVIGDGDITYTIGVAVTANDPNYNGNFGSNVEATNADNGDCDTIVLDVDLGDDIEACGTPGCSFTLIATNSEGTTEYGPFTLGDDGCVDTNVEALPDTSYSTGGDSPPSAPVVTVPTLGEWGMIAFIMLLGFAGVMANRRRADA